MTLEAWRPPESSQVLPWRRLAAFPMRLPRRQLRLSRFQGRLIGLIPCMFKQRVEGPEYIDNHDIVHSNPTLQLSPSLSPHFEKSYA